MSSADTQSPSVRRGSRGTLPRRASASFPSPRVRPVSMGKLAYQQLPPDQTTPEGPGAHPFWHPERALFRYLVLLVACLFSIGSYFAYDSIGVVQQELMDDFGITEEQFALLYTIYSLPNIVLPFFGGYMLDRIGIPIGTLISCTLVALGSMIVAVSAFDAHFWLMLVGRFLFGMGAEVSYVAQNAICCLWFKNRELALSMGLVVSAGRLGSFFTFNANAFIVNHYGDYRAALWLGAVLASTAFVGAVLYFFMHKLAARVSPALLQSPVDPGSISMRDVRYFPLVYWVVVFIVMVFYSTIFPFQSTATSYIQKKYLMPNDKAAFIVSLLPLSALFLSPIFGFIVDRVALRGVFVSIGLLALIPGFGLLMFSSWPQPYVSMILIGLVFSCVPAALWPSLPILIPEENIGLAFGILSGVINAGLSLFYWIQGRISSPVYEILLYVMLVLAGFVCSVWWNMMDYAKGGQVNRLQPTVHTIQEVQETDS
eukprot:TRINITY_DN4353_c0_g1_i1.p1 TRINITY_DN4353_c0_g1~~TRINITY_DN4353_c0_g1_i1.p1  ORF type:complete len:485 (-),score=72.07 TRINITY_DN4353_c0_g1_i1:61-1515(-)